MKRSDQVDSTFAFGKYSSFYKIYVVFCTRIQLKIDRLDHSGHLIRNSLVEKIIILREPFVSCKTKVYGYDADTSLNIYLKSYAGTVELHVQIMYKRIRCFVYCVFPLVRCNFNFILFYCCCCYLPHVGILDVKSMPLCDQCLWQRTYTCLNYHEIYRKWFMLRTYDGIWDRQQALRDHDIGELTYRSNRSFNIPSPGHTPGIWHLCRPGKEGIWLSESSRGLGIWSPCIRGGEFELHPRFHVKSLAWRAVMGTQCQRIFVEKIVPLWPIGYKVCAVFEDI